MNILEYFSDKNGTGVMATADKFGKVNTAIYARPHVFEDNSLAFIMRDRLTHHNLTQNGNANYLFYEKGDSYKGVRLVLSKLDESTDEELIGILSKRQPKVAETGSHEQRFLVRFKIEKAYNLIGGEELTLELT
jgi:hypothetical protein